MLIRRRHRVRSPPHAGWYTQRIGSWGHAAAGVAAAGALCLAAAVAAWLAVGGGSDRPPARRVMAQTERAPTQRRRRPARAARRRTLHPISVAQPPRPGPALAAGIDLAEHVIETPSSSRSELARAGLFEELATGVLARETVPERRATLGRLGPPARASMRANVSAAAALSGLAERRTHLPPWRIIAPPGPRRLRAIFRDAQMRFRVPWQYLAAVELVESRFGRIRGPSSAGAQGPMQFMPSTWAAYGHGSIDDPRAAILAAARYLAANGAPRDMAGALYHYNNSLGYVRAVRTYAERMRRAPRAYDGYYEWPVIYAYAGRTVILPTGFPRVRPVPLVSRSSADRDRGPRTVR